jgi:hypothetical protein
MTRRQYEFKRDGQIIVWDLRCGLSFAQGVAVNESMRFGIAGLGWWGRSWTDVLNIRPKAQMNCK